MYCKKIFWRCNVKSCLPSLPSCYTFLKSECSIRYFFLKSNAVLSRVPFISSVFVCSRWGGKLLWRKCSQVFAEFHVVFTTYIMQFVCVAVILRYLSFVACWNYLIAIFKFTTLFCTLLNRHYYWLTVVFIFTARQTSRLLTDRVLEV
jgi:hypothetical protein